MPTITRPWGLTEAQVPPGVLDASQPVGTVGALNSFVTALSGTAGQIVASAASGPVTVSLPATVTFPGTVTNPLSIFGATTSAQLAAVLTNETGTGLVVFNDTPVLLTPALGAATGASLVLSGALTAASVRPVAFAFADLATVLPANGNFGYCSDCTAGAAGVPAACTGAGTGAFAMRLNGAHRCWS